MRIRSTLASVAMLVTAAAGVILIASQAQVQTPGSAPAQAQAQGQAGDEQIWQEFIAWFKTAPERADVFQLYGEELGKRGLSKEEIGRRFGIITRLFAVLSFSRFTPWAIASPMAVMSSTMPGFTTRRRFFRTR